MNDLQIKIKSGIEKLAKRLKCDIADIYDFIRVNPSTITKSDIENACHKPLVNKQRFRDTLSRRVINEKDYR